ncbi:MAG: prepilin-type N-terminal cleavage/methylation domain-containing protein [Firmicutes bacterium]|nr:prepilin-type N-terminal cleavage/methylation domain-containing protein [Bacillota bacterium]
MEGGKQQGGFTLVELLVALAVAALVIGTTSTFILAWQSQVLADYTLAQQQNDQRYALHVITHHLRRARNIQVERSGGVTAMLLTLPNGSLLRIGHSERLETIWLHSANHPICSHISSMQVDVGSLPLVTIRIVSSSQLPGSRRGLPFELVKQVRLRNYAGR